MKLLNFLAFSVAILPLSGAWGSPPPAPPVGQVIEVVRTGESTRPAAAPAVAPAKDPRRKALEKQVREALAEELAQGGGPELARLNSEPLPGKEATAKPTAAGGEAADPGAVSTDETAVVDPKKGVEELEKFEELAFPQPGTGPGQYSAPPAVAPRPSAENPPPALTTESSTTATEPAPPEPWLAKLAKPDIGVRWTPKLLKFLNFYRTNPRGRQIMTFWLKRMGRFSALFETTLRKHGLPRSLVYVAMIESGFSPTRTSRVGAAGLWQFMPKTGKGYGLDRDYWVDERRNPELSSEAAARYLKSLHDRLGSWELALAAYNAGFGAVVVAAQKYNTNDYWTLCGYEAGLPWSTTLYVPKILAAAVVGHNRAFFGYDKVTPDPSYSFDKVTVPGSITLTQAARAAGVTKDEVTALNPELRRGRTPPQTRSWLRVPRGTAQRFYANLRSIKRSLAKNRPYVIRLGESEAAIARKFGTSRHTLRRLNGFASSRELRPGMTILVPANKPRNQLKSKAKKKSPDKDDRILVPLPRGVVTKVKGRKRVFYRVVLGDSLAEIAAHLQVTQQELAAWNAVDPGARLISTMVLQAFVPQTFDQSQVVLLDPKRLRVMVAGSEAFLNVYEKRKGRQRKTYTVRKGDSMTAVARRMGLSLGDLCRINNLGRRAKLKTGQKLVVYVTSKAKASRKKTSKRRSKVRKKNGKTSKKVKARSKRKTKSSKSSKKSRKTKSSKKSRKTKSSKKSRKKTSAMSPATTPDKKAKAKAGRKKPNNNQPSA